MKTSMYFNYASRSLVRGGQRTMLAIFCIAIGVLAIVALQLVGLMINNAFTVNVRDANGGDIAVRSQNQPFIQSDLSYFNQLEKAGIINNYTPVVNTQGASGANLSLKETFSIRVVDAQNYPVVTPPIFSSPSNGKLANLLKNDQVVVTQPFIDQYKKKIGDTFAIHIGSRDQGGRTLHVKLAGIVTDSGILAQSGSVVLLSRIDYQAAAPKEAILYDTINIVTNQSHINQAVKDIQYKFPIASTQTAADALKAQQSTIDNIQKFLEIAGLMALLIGGVGIVNTMQVLLSRRKTEIAMLKTTGYRRFDLYLLFGLEAGLLGLVGGIVGAAGATGVSYLVRNLVQQTFQLNIPFLLDWLTLGGGVLIGLVTALIFGLLPIVQAANIRPLNVIRELPEGRGVASVILTIFLLFVLSILFCLLAIVVLNHDVVLGVTSVYGTFAFLGLLSLFCGLLIFILSKLPVPEQFSIGYLGLVIAMIAISALLLWLLPVFGIMSLVVALMGLVVVVLPRTWKATIKMALRNLGRQRARTTTTMIALFVGIFTIGLIVVLGQNLHDAVSNVLTNSLNYNVFAITSNSDTTRLQNKLTTIPGLTLSQQHTLASTSPVTVNNQPIQQLLAKGSRVTNRVALYYLSGLEGYDVADNQIPSTQFMSITAGRNLRPSDAGSNNIVISYQLAQNGPLYLKVGDKVTLTGVDRTSMRTVTIVGIYRNSTTFGGSLYPLLATKDTVKALSPRGVSQSIFYLKIDPNKLSQATDRIGSIVPNAFVFNLASISDFIDQLLNDILLTLTTIASLSLLAGLIVIANAVALAMLERRRELGILKSVGYTSRTILSEVLLENGLVGATGALLAMLLVTLVTSLMGKFVFNLNFSVNAYTTIELILGSALLAMLASALVAWQAVRVRPLDVLRYE